MIADFVVEKVNRYIIGGMNTQTATRFICGELSAIYRGDHFGKDSTGKIRSTLPPEKLDIETAMKKADAAITEIINCNHSEKMKQEKTYTYHVSELEAKGTEILRNVYRGSAAIKQTLAAGIAIKDFFSKSSDNDSSAYTTDMGEIATLWSNGRRRFKAFIRGKFLVLDIDRKPGKIDGLKEFYRLFSREILPAELQCLPESFPTYTQTPSGGFHLYFKYDGLEFKLRELAPGVEVKELQVTTSGSRKENGEYVLHGELDNAPPLYGVIVDAIEKTKRKKEQTKAERSRPQTQAAADYPLRVTNPRITLDILADEAVAAYSGHHDRQVSFSGRACRCKFSSTDTLSYVKSHPDIFGNGSDTENTVLSVFRDRDFGAV